MGNIFEKAPAETVPQAQGDVPQNPQAPGLGGPGLPPRNPVVALIRGNVGARGAGESRSVMKNVSRDVRGEAGAVLRNYGNIPQLQSLENPKNEDSRMAQIENRALRRDRKIIF